MVIMLKWLLRTWNSFVQVLIQKTKQVYTHICSWVFVATHIHNTTQSNWIRWRRTDTNSILIVYNDPFTQTHTHTICAHNSMGYSFIIVPQDDDTGGLCPLGYYCLEGTPDPYHTPCQNGTYGNWSGSTSEDDCSDCPPGMVCSGQALTEPNDLCAPGYYCTERAKTRYPTDGVTGNICPVGFYCPEGSPAPKRCEGGYYTNITGQASCFDCPACKYDNIPYPWKVHSVL